MEFCTFVSTVEDIRRAAFAPGLREVLIEPQLTAFRGTLLRKSAEDLAKSAISMDLTPILVWDTFMPQRRMETTCRELKGWNLDLFKGVRTADPGAAEWIAGNDYLPPVQFIAENGNNNLKALQGWCEYFGNRLSRIVLSPELPKSKLEEFCCSLPIPCEILGAGLLPIFYSPRPLLSSLKQPGDWKDEDTLHMTASSNDSGNRDFPVIETRHGTVMYLDKDYFVLDKLTELKEAGVCFLRVDLRHFSSGKDSACGIDDICTKLSADSGITAKEWPGKTCAPFFRTNKTTAQFHRLKSPLCSLRDELCCAVVLSTVKDDFCVIQTLQECDFSRKFILHAPNGECVELSALRPRDLTGRELAVCGPGRTLVLPYLKKSSPGALIRIVS